MSAANQLPTAMTASEFLAWDPQDGDRLELIDGIPCAMAPASPRHGAIQSEATRLIANHLADTRPACMVFVEAGIQPKVCADVNVRVPNLAVTCATWDDSRDDGARASRRGRDTVAFKPDYDLAECMELHNDPERAGDPRPPHDRRSR